MNLKHCRTYTALLFSLSLFSIIRALAADPEPTGEAPLTPPDDTTAAAPLNQTLDSPPPAQRTLGLGFTTVTGVQTGSNRPSFSGLFSIGENSLLQIFFSIPTTNPFTASGGALYKYTIFGDQAVGFHLGAGGAGGSIAAYGTSNVLLASISGIIGFHFKFSNLKQIAFHLDGGPTYSYQNTSQFPTNFTLDACSSNLGLSVLYLFD